MATDEASPRLAVVEDAGEVARLLHDFNTEFDTPSPVPAVLAERLRVLFVEDTTFAILAGTPSVAVALVTLRTNVWYDGPVALLDELVEASIHRFDVRVVVAVELHELVGGEVELLP